MKITYPVVSQKEVIDLFHAILYWRWMGKNNKGLNPCYWYITFDFVSKVLVELNILPERRIDTLRSNRDFTRLFLAKTAVIEQTDSREWVVILGEEKKCPFLVKISEPELVNGNRINQRDLFASRRIFITARGIATGPIAEKAVEKLLARDSFEQFWRELIAQDIPKAAFGARRKRYNLWLGGEMEEEEE